MMNLFKDRNETQKWNSSKPWIVYSYLTIVDILQILMFGSKQWKCKSLELKWVSYFST